jgi:hypothetical protein
MKTLYARYNRHRLPSFQIETSIVGLNGSRFVVKKALTDEAKSHIAAMRSGYELVQRHLKSDNLILPRLEKFDDFSVSFQYIEGQSLDQALFQSFRAGDQSSFFRNIDNYCALLKESFGLTAPSTIHPKLAEVFGVTDQDKWGENTGWLPLALVDAMFENIILSGRSYYLIDNEWVFDGKLPFDFILFRSLFYFHKVKYFELGIEKWIPFADLTAHYRIKPAQAEKYLAMDDKFQGYVYGAERCYTYKEHYKKRQISIHSLESTVAHQREVVRKYHDAILRNEATINEMRNSFSWRIGRKITGVLNHLCPENSLRRKIMKRLIVPGKASPK